MSTMTTLMAAVLCAAMAGCAARPGADEAPPPPPSGGEVPDGLVQEMIADLASKTGADAGAVEVVRAEAVTWNDSSLGCAEPGHVYMQMLTEGYQVILRHGGKKYDYRAGGGGSFILCERPDRKGPTTG